MAHLTELFSLYFYSFLGVYIECFFIYIYYFFLSFSLRHLSRLALSQQLLSTQSFPLDPCSWFNIAVIFIGLPAGCFRGESSMWAVFLAVLIISERESSDNFWSQLSCFALWRHYKLSWRQEWKKDAEVWLMACILGVYETIFLPNQKENSSVQCFGVHANVLERCQETNAATSYEFLSFAFLI